jgi:hypothetical protein
VATSSNPKRSSARSPSKDRSSKSAGTAATRKASSSAQKRSGSGSGASRRPAKASARQKAESTATAQRAADESGNGRAAIAKGALGALLGTAALGLAGRAAIKRGRSPRVLGVRVPRELSPSNFDLKKVAKQIENFAERMEHTSDDVRLVSAQAKRVSKRLS